MRTLVIISAFLMSSISWGQYIYHPLSSKSVVKIKSGKSYKYYDSGGPNENYSYNTNSLITFYPDKEGEFVSLNCNSLELASDTRMYIFDGNHPGSPIIGYFNGKTGLSGNVYTASSENASGAISVRFVSLKRRTNLKGWDFTVSSSSTPGKTPTNTTSDCSGAIKVCSDSAITTQASGPGIQEMPGPGFWSGTINNGKNGEIQSNWYKFEVKTAGTIDFLITPNSHTDFDWALWGPYDAHECPAWTTDWYYRASACDGNYHDGLTGTSSNVSRPVGRFDTDECFVAPLQVKAGEHYVIMIDDWSGKSTTFKLSWKFSNGASLECKADEEPPAVPEDEEIILEIIDEEKDSIINEAMEAGKDSTDIFKELEEELKIDPPKLEADVSPDQQSVTLKYPGAFEWKIENMEGETVKTGHSVDSQEVDISNLPKGQYRASLIYKQIKQYTTFYRK